MSDDERSMPLSARRRPAGAVALRQGTATPRWVAGAFPEGFALNSSETWRANQQTESDRSRDSVH